MRVAVSVAAALVGIVLTGSARMLVAAPPVLLLLCAVAIAAIAIPTMRNHPRQCAIAAGCGFLIAASLPVVPPLNPGKIVTRNIPRHESGDLFALLDKLDRDPASVLGSQAIVSGGWTPPTAGRPASVS